MKVEKRFSKPNYEWGLPRPKGQGLRETGRTRSVRQFGLHDFVKERTAPFY